MSRPWKFGGRGMGDLSYFGLKLTEKGFLNTLGLFTQAL